VINSIGNLAGFVAPYAMGMGYLKDTTGGFTAGLLAVVFFPVGHPRADPRGTTRRSNAAPSRRGATSHANYGFAQPSKALWGQ
jgi:hypothetical protein